MLFRRRELATLPSQQMFLKIREGLAGAGIDCTCKVRGMARAAERRARLGGRPDRELSYTIYVDKNDYERAAHLLQSLRRGG